MEATPWGVYTVVLVGVVILMAVGMAGVLSLGAKGTGTGAPGPVASAVDPTVVPDAAGSPSEAPHVPLVDIVAVDLRTGNASALPWSIRKILDAGHFRVSPDGTEIAFDDGESIFVAAVDGSHIRRFTAGQGSKADEGAVSAPAWSPDGSKIVFGEANSAFLLDIGTGSITRLIRERGPVWYPNFSPDGRTILYTTLRRWALTLRTVGVAGGPSSDLIRGAFGAYSPDGTTIAYRRTSYHGSDTTEMTSGSLWLAQADGSHAHEIGLRAGWMSQIDPEALWPIWSPNGTKIAYQPTFFAAIRVIDIGLDRGSKVAAGVDPSWLDDHTLIITDFHRVAPDRVAASPPPPDASAP